jgi:hypothetical protein
MGKSQRGQNDPDSSGRWEASRGVLLVIFICCHRSFSVDRRRNLNFEKISKDFEKSFHFPIIQGLPELADQNNTVKSLSSGNDRKNI